VSKYVPFMLRRSLADTNDHSSKDQTINALYAIEPARNQGLDFQYEEVVRGKDDRRRMDAGDCECCRDVSFAKSLSHEVASY
jgi:hypothetical protein